MLNLFNFHKPLPHNNKHFQTEHKADDNKEMHYIKFLKLPVLASSKQGSIIKTVIAMTTDLGDDYFPSDVTLEFELLAQNPAKPKASSNIILSHTRQWSIGMRALPVELKVPSKSANASTIYQLRVDASKSGYSTSFDFSDGTLVTPRVMPVLSAPFSTSSPPADPDFDVIRVVPLKDNPELRVYEATGDSIARHIWDGSVAFSGLIDQASIGKSGISYLDSIVARKEVLNVIELGAGVGLAGLTLAHVMPRIRLLLTDVPEVEPLLARSIKANGMDTTRTRFAVLDWEKPVPEGIRNQKYDLILVSECTYNEDSIPALVTVLQALMEKSPTATILVATKQRHENERIFYEFMEQAGFGIVGQTHALCPRNFSTDDLEDAEKVNVYTFRLKEI